MWEVAGKGRENRWWARSCQGDSGSREIFGEGEQGESNTDNEKGSFAETP
jgi:hypothetical protein